MIIILGSSSPRRRELLGNIIEHFEILVPLTEEAPRPHELPVEFTNRISREKMDSILSMDRGRGNPQLLITSDTIVSIEGQILGKPSNYEDALHKLTLLKGRTHRVITSITLLYLNSNSSMDNKILTGHEITEVTFKNLTLRDLEDYLKKIDYMDKAGAYAVQDYGSIIIQNIQGSFTNIIGFPLRLFFSMMADMGIDKFFL